MLGEADGDAKYRSKADSPERVIRREKDRETRLRRQLRVLVRWGWREAVTPDLLIDILSRAGIPRPAPPDTTMLSTLSSLRRPEPSRETATAFRD